jgi:hypothetical protein
MLTGVRAVSCLDHGLLFHNGLGQPPTGVEPRSWTSDGPTGSYPASTSLSYPTDAPVTE